MFPNMPQESTALKIYLPSDDAAKLREIAQAEDRTVTTLIRRLVREYLSGREEVAA